MRGVDTRVYTLIRVSFAIVAFLNLLQLWPDRIVFFTRSGITHGAGWPAGSGVWYSLSIFAHATSEAAVNAVFLAAAAAMVCLGLGVWARLSALLVLYWHISFTTSILAMNVGWDELLRNVAVFVAIGPLGAPLIGRGRRGEAVVAEESPRYAAVLFQLLLATIYWQTVWEKVPDPFWQNGEMISYFMISEYARWPSMVWAEPPLVLISNLLSYGTLVAEAAIPILLWRRKTRWIGFACGLALHGGIALVSPIWMFSLTIMIPYLAFLERADFDWLVNVWRGTVARGRRVLGRGDREAGMVESSR